MNLHRHFLRAPESDSIGMVQDAVRWSIRLRREWRAIAALAARGEELSPVTRELLAELADRAGRNARQMFETALDALDCTTRHNLTGCIRKLERFRSLARFNEAADELGTCLLGTRSRAGVRPGTNCKKETSHAHQR